MNVKRYPAADAGLFITDLAESHFASPIHQISAAFTDGNAGFALLGKRGAAVVVGDLVELIGDFDTYVYGAMRTKGEAHIPEPPQSWITGIAEDPSRRLSSYERTAFYPVPSSETDGNICREPKINSAHTSDGVPIDIVPIGNGLIPRLLSERWSADLVANTMAPPNEHLGGFGFVAVSTKRTPVTTEEATTDGRAPDKTSAGSPVSTIRSFGNRVNDTAILGGVGCYAMYRRGIEVQIDVLKEYRRRGIAQLLGARMVRECAARSLECHWDAMNAASTALAKKLGFREERRYRCYALTNA